jgi:hypothetical protein
VVETSGFAYERDITDAELTHWLYTRDRGLARDWGLVVKTSCGDA